MLEAGDDIGDRREVERFGGDGRAGLYAVPLGRGVRGDEAFARERHAGEILLVRRLPEDERDALGAVERGVLRAVVNGIENKAHGVDLRLHLVDLVAVDVVPAVDDGAVDRAAKVTGEGRELARYVDLVARVGERRAHEKAVGAGRKLERHIAALGAERVVAERPVALAGNGDDIVVLAVVLEVAGDVGDQRLAVGEDTQRAVADIERVFHIVSFPGRARRPEVILFHIEL